MGPQTAHNVDPDSSVNSLPQTMSRMVADADVFLHLVNPALWPQSRRLPGAPPAPIAKALHRMTVDTKEPAKCSPLRVRYAVSSWAQAPSAPEN